MVTKPEEGSRISSLLLLATAIKNHALPLLECASDVLRCCSSFSSLRTFIFGFVQTRKSGKTHRSFDSVV